MSIIARFRLSLARRSQLVTLHGSGTFRKPLLFSGLRRFVGLYLMRTGAGCCRAELIHVTTELYHFNMLMTLEIGQQQCCIICVQFTCRATKMIQRLISAFSQDQSAIKCLKFCSTATRLHYRRRKSRLRRSTLPRPVCGSSF